MCTVFYNYIIMYLVARNNVFKTDSNTSGYSAAYTQQPVHLYLYSLTELSTLFFYIKSSSSGSSDSSSSSSSSSSTPSSPTSRPSNMDATSAVAREVSDVVLLLSPVDFLLASSAKPTKPPLASVLVSPALCDVGKKKRQRRECQQPLNALFKEKKRTRLINSQKQQQ